MLLLFPSPCGAQEEPREEKTKAQHLQCSRRNSWSVFIEYALNSSHIFLGFAEQRRLVAVGGEYSHRYFLNRWMGFDYLAQIRPLVLAGDPALSGYRSPTTGQTLIRLAHPGRVAIVDRSPVIIGIPQLVSAVPIYSRECVYVVNYEIYACIKVHLKIYGFHGALRECWCDCPTEDSPKLAIVALSSPA